MLLVLLLACGVRDLIVDEVVAPPCAARAAFYADADGDGVGAAAAVAITCTAPDGYVTTSGDCDDADAAVAADCGDTGPGDTGPGDTGT